MAGKGTIGAKLVLEGESQYRSALKNIKSAQSELRSEMKLCASEFKTSQNSIAALQTKYDVLTRQVGEAQKKYDVYSTALSEAKAKQAELGTALSEAQSKYDAAAKSLEEMKNSTETSNDELEQQQKLVDQCAQEISDAQGKYDACTKKVTDYQTSLNYAGAELAEFKNDQEQTARYLEEAQKATDQCATSIDEYGKEVNEAEKETKTFGDTLSANLTSEAIVKGVELLVNGIKSIASACIDTGMAFEKSMSTVEALSGATGQDLEDLTNKAREMGAATLYSAADAADALGYMALAGWNTQQMLEGIAPVMNLAIASNMDLAEASDIVTDNITAFGLTVDQSTKFADQMAYAMSNSNTDTEQLGEAYKNCAAAAGSMGFSVEDTTAALMVMADAGQKGSEAGTGLKTIMTRLATDTKSCASELAKYGVNVYDAQGNMNSLSSILIGCGEIWKGLTDEEQNNLAVTIAGQNQFNKFQTIMMGMNDAAKESGKSFEDYTKALETCDGAAQQMADTMADNLQGAIWNLESGLEAVEETVYSALSDSLKEGVEEAADALTRLDNSMKTGDTQVALARLGDSVGNFVENAADMIEDIMPAFITTLTWIIDNAGLIASGIAGVTTAIAAYNAVTKVAGALSTAFSLALPTGQLALFASLAAGAAAAIGMMNFTKEATDAERLGKEMENLNSTLAASKETREENRKEMEVTASTVKALISELDNENTSNKRKAQIVAELNTAMPELNLAYDEQNDLLSMSTEELEANADAMVQRLKLAAAEDDLTAIIEDQYEAEKKLREIKDEVTEKYGIQADSAQECAEKLKEMADAEMEVNAQISLQTGIMANVPQSTVDMLTYVDAINEANETIDSLTEEYDSVNEYIGENTSAVTENTDAVNGNSDAITNNGLVAQEVSEEVMKAFEDAKESVVSSLSSAADEFQSLGQEALGLKDTTVASFDEIKQSMDEWAAGVDSYADSVAIAEMIMGSDSNTAAYLQSLIDKGPSAAAELDAVTDAYYNNNEAFDQLVETYNQANSIIDSLGDLEAGMSTGYDAMYQAGLDAITERAPELTEEMQANFDEQAQAVEEGTAEVQNAMTEGYAAGATDQTDAIAETTTAVAQEGIIDPLNETLGTDGTTSTETTTVGENVDQGLIDGVENKQEEVTTKAETLATDTYDTINETLAEDKFQTIGEQICSGLVSGLDKGSSSVATKAKQVAQSAYDEARKELDVHSPSKKFAYLGEMSGEGFTEGLIESMQNIDSVVSNATESAAKAVAREARANSVFSKASSNTANYGGVNITVYGAEGQNVNDLANIVMTKINNQFTRNKVAFG